jgi:cation transport ATPase
VKILADDPTIQSILNRPISERLREHKFRFAQCMVFGLPVLALHFFGPKLGGPEAGRWIGLLQALLSGWCLYLAALPMLSESLMLLSLGKVKVELFISMVTMVLYLVGLVGWIFTLRGHEAVFPGAFAIAVVILIIWSGVQWLWLSNQNAP